MTAGGAAAPPGRGTPAFAAQGVRAIPTRHRSAPRRPHATDIVFPEQEPDVNTTSLRAKLNLLSLLVLVTLLGVTAYDALVARTHLFDQRKSMLKAIIESAQATFAYYRKLETAGSLTREQAQNHAREALRGLRYQGQEYIFVYAMDGHNVLLPPKPEREGTMMIDLKDPNGYPVIRNSIEAARHGGGYVEYLWPKPGETVPSPKVSYVAPVEGWDWYVGTGMYLDDVSAAVWRGIAGSLLVSLACATGLALLVHLTGRAILRQVGGEPTEAMALMRRVAEGDLTAAVGEGHGDGVIGAMNGVVRQMRGLLAQVAANVSTLRAASRSIGATAGGVVETAQVQSGTAATVADDAASMTRAIEAISETALETERLAAQAVELAERGQGLVSSAGEEMSRIAATANEASAMIAALTQSAGQVGTLANVIKDIATQTNLLALNAAIEAARAGEQGRGFAVVADEVRQLSAKTSEATLEIERMVVARSRPTRSAPSAPRRPWCPRWSTDRNSRAVRAGRWTRSATPRRARSSASGAWPRRRASRPVAARAWRTASARSPTWSIRPAAR
jgi:methyl-accepting chemotaxis protein